MARYIEEGRSGTTVVVLIIGAITAFGVGLVGLMMLAPVIAIFYVISRLRAGDTVGEAIQGPLSVILLVLFLAAVKSCR